MATTIPPSTTGQRSIPLAQAKKIAAQQKKPAATKNPAPTPLSSAGQQPTSLAIRVVQGDLHRICGQANALLASKSPRTFRYGGTLVHVERIAERMVLDRGGTIVPENALRLEPASKEWLQMELTRIGRWERAITSVGQAIKWVATDAPLKVVGAILADRAGWQCRVLNGVSEVPVLRDDGSAFETPGYDSRTGIYFHPNGASFKNLRPNPTYADAQLAIDFLLRPLKDFPFVQECHRSAALAMIMTGVIRRQLPKAPGFGISATVAGTGKGLLTSVAAMIATDRVSPVTAFTDDEDEQRKRITAALVAGHPIINVDNVTETLNSAALCALLTSESWTERLLGKSRDVTVPSNALLMCNGNNLVIQGDLTRRLVPIMLDAECEHPEERKFDKALLPWVKTNRPMLVLAVLTILSAWRKAGRPDQGLQPLGSFEEWSQEIASPLVWLGQPDPTLALTQLGIADPKCTMLRRVLANWYTVFGSTEQTLGMVLETIKAPTGPQDYDRAEHAELREAFDEITANARDDAAKKARFGRWLSKHAGRVVQNEDRIALRFVNAGSQQRAVRWAAEELSPPEERVE